MHEDELRAEMVRIAHCLYAKNLVAGSDGNISARLSDGTLLTTPSGKSKGDLTPDDLVRTDVDGKPLGAGKPSSEIRMHLKAYALRPDVMACVHAHPPMTVALSLLGDLLARPVLPELLLYLGRVAIAPYATPTTADVAEAVAPLVDEHDVIVLTGHGSATLGGSLSKAYVKLEALEHGARILHAVLQVQPPPELSAAEVKRLLGIHESAVREPRHC